ALGPVPPFNMAMLLGVSAAIACRHPLALLAGFHVTTAVSIALIAMAAMPRLTASLEWANAVFAAAAVMGLLEWVERGERPRGRPGDDGSWGRAGTLVLVAGGLGVTFALAGFAMALSRPRPPRPTVELPSEPWTSRLDAETRGRFAAALDRVVVRRTRVRPGFEIHLAARESVEHWARLFDPRPYAFTVFETDPEIPELYAVMPGLLGREVEGQDLVLVGIRTPRADDGSTLELVAIGVAPAGGEPTTWLHTTGAAAQAHAERIAALSSASSPR
ncbi:MAG: hypothetical protein ACAI25_19710, partial [Planctomycetota bacterium]